MEDRLGRGIFEVLTQAERKIPLGLLGCLVSLVLGRWADLKIRTRSRQPLKWPILTLSPPRFRQQVVIRPNSGTRKSCTRTCSETF